MLNFTATTAAIVLAAAATASLPGAASAQTDTAQIEVDRSLLETQAGLAEVDSRIRQAAKDACHATYARSGRMVERNRCMRELYESMTEDLDTKIETGPRFAGQ